MNHTHELCVHRRSYQLQQGELAHLLGVTPGTLHRLEKGAKAQLADLEMILGLEVVFGKASSHIFAEIFVRVQDAVMRRATELEKVWQTLGDAKSKVNLALLDEMIARAKVTTETP